MDYSNNTDKSIFFGEIVVGRVLEVRINKSVSNCQSFEVEFQGVFIFENEIMGNSRDVMPSVAFSGNVEVFSLELRESKVKRTITFLKV